MSYFKIFVSVVLTLVLVIFGLARIAFEILGASTAPDDFEALKQRMPKLLEWLFTTPWFVPTIMFLLLSALAAWLLVSGTKRATHDEIEDFIQIDEACVAKMIRAAIAAIPKPDPPQIPPPPKLEKLDLMARYLVSVERKKRAEVLTKRVDEYLEWQIANPLSPVLFGGRGTHFNNYGQEFTAVGIKGADGAFENIAKEVEGNAVYAVILEGEQFTQPSQKQQYHIALKKLRWVKDACAKVSYPMTSVEFLSRFNSQCELIERQ